jgi:hypothetical protein
MTLIYPTFSKELSQMPIKTTPYTPIFTDLQTLITPAYLFYIHGDFIPQDTIKIINYKLIGLHQYSDCLQKAQIVQEVLGGKILMGSCDFFDPQGNSYGFDFKPPLSFHCWNSFPHEIIVDYGLQGLIEMGILSGALDPTPSFVLATRPRENVIYRPKCEVIFTD